MINSQRNDPLLRQGVVLVPGLDSPPVAELGPGGTEEHLLPNTSKRDAKGVDGNRRNSVDMCFRLHIVNRVLVTVPGDYRTLR